MSLKIYDNIIVFLLLLSSAYSIQAQSYRASETMTTIDGEYTKAMVITLPSDADDTEDEWEDYLEDNYDLELDKVKRKRDTTTYISEKVIMNNLNGVSYDIYTKVVDREDGSTDLYTKWAFNEDILVESEDNPQKAADAKYMMEDFAKKEYIKFYSDRLENLEDERKDAVKDFDKLERKTEKLEKSNRKLKKRISKYEEDIIENQEQKEANRTEMEQLEKTSISLQQKIDAIQFELKKVEQ